MHLRTVRIIHLLGFRFRLPQKSPVKRRILYTLIVLIYYIIAIRVLFPYRNPNAVRVTIPVVNRNQYRPVPYFIIGHLLILLIKHRIAVFIFILNILPVKQIF